MNEQVRLPLPIGSPRATRAAEGRDRWHWSTAEIEELWSLRVFDEFDRFELVGGEIVPMSPLGQRHERVVSRLQRLMVDRRDHAVWVDRDPQLNLDEASYKKPDLLAVPAAVDSYDIRGPTALLVVEVSDSSIDHDLKEKMHDYASYGVREYWVIDAWELVTWVHREPGASGYATVTRHGPTDLLTPHLAPSLAIRLAELGLERLPEVAG